MVNGQATIFSCLVDGHSLRAVYDSLHRARRGAADHRRANPHKSLDMIIVYSRRANRYRNLGDKERPIGSNLTFGAPFDSGDDFVGHLVQQKGRGEIPPPGPFLHVRQRRCGPCGPARWSFWYRTVDTTSHRRMRPTSRGIDPHTRCPELRPSQDRPTESAVLDHLGFLFTCLTSVVTA
jgi:hypothetical protein